MKIVGADLMSKGQKLWPAPALSTLAREGLPWGWLPAFNQELLNGLCGQLGKELRFHWLSTHSCCPFLYPSHVPSPLSRPSPTNLTQLLPPGEHLLSEASDLGLTDHENLPEACPGALATLGRVVLCSEKTCPSSLVTLSRLKRITSFKLS